MKTLYAAFLAALVSMTIYAADEPRQGDAAGQALNEHPKDEKLTYRQRMVAGKVTDMKEADVTQDGKNENHVLLKVETFQGRTLIVDVGPKAGMRHELKTGDEIAAFGVAGRLNERPLIVASKIAHIMPIEGREDIYETLPADFDKEAGYNQNMNSNQQLAKEGLRQSNENAVGIPRQVSADGFRSPCLDK
jgi:hypothetical protein